MTRIVRRWQVWKQHLANRLYLIGAECSQRTVVGRSAARYSSFWNCHGAPFVVGKLEKSLSLPDSSVQAAAGHKQVDGRLPTKLARSDGLSECNNNAARLTRL